MKKNAYILNNYKDEYKCKFCKFTCRLAITMNEHLNDVHQIHTRQNQQLLNVLSRQYKMRHK